MSAVSRRTFITAGATLLGVTAAGPSFAADTGDVVSQASRTYGVPAALLAAISHAQTGWTDHGALPSRSMGHGPMHLIDGAAVQAKRAAEGREATHTVDTLGDAARAAGLDPQKVRSDARSNMRAAAALMAKTQREARRPVGAGTDPGQWYATTALISGMATTAAQARFADDVMATLSKGATVHAADATVTLKSRKVSVDADQRKAVSKRGKTPTQPPAEGPRGLGIEWLPAAYEQTGPGEGDYGNHDLAYRPEKLNIDQIIVHDTECEFDVALDLVKDPTYLAWHYSLRSSDGHIAQHIQARHVGWHAGNWYVNAHSIGLEHEGFAAEGPTWYTEAMYKTSAKLVRHLAKEYGIPLDRGHIIGHDQVPATTTENIAGMHWDPGPYWNWERYFQHMGAPLRAGTTGRAPKVGDVVRILPDFDTNTQLIDGTPRTGVNFVYLYTEPSKDADLVTDAGIKDAPSTTQVADIGARAAVGCDYVVAKVEGEWLAVWYLGALAWLHNPKSSPAVRVVNKGRKVTVKGASAQTFGRALPEASAYSDPEDVQEITPLLYTLGEGQQYALLDDDVPTDYYKAKTFSLDTPDDHVNISGETKYYLISLGHRQGYVLADEVE